MRGLVDELLEAKAVAGECDEYPRIPALSTWAASAVAELEEDVAALVPKPKMAWERLNDVFLVFLDMDRTPVGDSLRPGRRPATSARVLPAWTDLEPECDRSRGGTGPISANRTAQAT